MLNKEYLCPCGTQPLETGRLLLRAFSFDDADSMMRNWAGDDQVQDMYGEPSYKTHEEMRGLLEKYISSYVIRYGFEKINFNKVQICVRPSNLPSKKVIDKCGFTYEGTLREYFFRNGKYEDRMYHSILRKEF